MLPPRNFQSRRKGAPVKSEVHRKWLKTFECVCFGNSVSPCDIDHDVQLAHYRSAENSGTGKKPSDLWLMPLCRSCHRRQHDIGQPAFEAMHGFSMRDKALEFACVSRDPKIKAAAAEYVAKTKPA
jgi:5-methylcytosine-specific restriction endonuclease McrA